MLHRTSQKQSNSNWDGGKGERDASKAYFMESRRSKMKPRANKEEKATGNGAQAEQDTALWLQGLHIRAFKQRSLRA